MNVFIVHQLYTLKTHPESNDYLRIFSKSYRISRIPAFSIPTRKNSYIKIEIENTPDDEWKPIYDFNWIRESANKTIILSSTNMHKQLNANNTIFVESQLAD